MNVPNLCRPARLRKILLGTLLLLALQATYAALTITENVTPTLGTLLGGASGRNFILNTDQTVSGTDSADYLFGAVSGDLSVKQTGGPASANILADNYSTTGGVTVNGVPCKWHNDAATTCHGSGINITVQATRTLLVGIDLDTSQVHAGGDTASATYDITISLL